MVERGRTCQVSAVSGGVLAVIACVVAVGLSACGSDDQQTTTLQQQNTALAQRNAALTARNRALAAENAALTRKVTNTAQQNALLQLKSVDRASRIAALKARAERTARAADRARASAVALGRTAEGLGARNGKLKASVARLRAQLRSYELAAAAVAADYALAQQVSDTLLRCTDLVRKAYNGSRSAGAARSVCRVAAKRLREYGAG